VVDAVGSNLGELRDYVIGAVTNALPGTAEVTLPEWYEMLGIPYDETQTLKTRQDRAQQQWTAVGGQSLDYLNGVIQIAYPDVEIELTAPFATPDSMAGFGEAGRMEARSYPSWLTPVPTDGSFPSAYYRVIGEVPDVSDLSRLLGLLGRIAPAEMEPVLAITVLNLTPAAEAGLGMSGLMEAGRSLT
jgi:hypothetical protein